MPVRHTIPLGIVIFLVKFRLQLLYLNIIFHVRQLHAKILPITKFIGQSYMVHNMASLTTFSSWGSDQAMPGFSPLSYLFLYNEVLNLSKSRIETYM